MTALWSVLSALELPADSDRRRVRIQEDVPLDGVDTGFFGDTQRDAAVGRVTVDEKQRTVVLNLVHQPLHVTGVSRQEAAAVIVDADRARHGSQRVVEGTREGHAAHVERNGSGFAAGVVDRGLQRQVHEHFLAVRQRGVGYSSGTGRAGQDRAGDGAGQCDRALAGGPGIAEVIDNNGDPGPRLGAGEGRQYRQQEDQREREPCHFALLCNTPRLAIRSSASTS